MFCHDSLEKTAAIRAAPDRAISGVSSDLAVILDCEVYPAPRSKRTAASSAVISVQRAERQWPSLFACRRYISRSSSPLATSILMPPAIGVPFASASTQRGGRWLPADDTKT